MTTYRIVEKKTLQNLEWKLQYKTNQLNIREKEKTEAEKMEEKDGRTKIILLVNTLNENRPNVSEKRKKWSHWIK